MAMPADPNSTEAFSRVKRHILNAYANVPFYRKLYDGAGVHPGDLESLEDLPKLPTISKEQIIADQKRSPPFGDIALAEAALTRVNLIASTYYVCLTHDDQRAVTAMFEEMFGILGVRRQDLVDISSAYHWVSGGTQMDAAMRGLGAAVIPGGPGHSEQRIRVLRETRATVLQAFTPYAEELSRRFAEYGVDPKTDLHVRLLIIGGELRDAAAKQRLEDAWGGAAVREYYGVSEAGILAAECLEAGDGMHISSHVHVEVVDPATGQAVPPGQSGEIVTTELVRSAQPFIRYRTGDITEGIRSAPCRCGRHSRRLGRILGRSAEIPRIRGLFIAPALIERTVRSYDEAGEWRLVISRPGTIDLAQLQVELGAPPDRRDFVAADLAKRLKDNVGIAIEVELVAPGSIEKAAKKVDDRRQFR